MKIQTPGTGGLARSISGHETGLPEKPPLQATRKGGKWRVVHDLNRSILKGVLSACHFSTGTFTSSGIVTNSVPSCFNRVMISSSASAVPDKSIDQSPPSCIKMMEPNPTLLSTLSWITSGPCCFQSSESTSQPTAVKFKSE